MAHTVCCDEKLAREPGTAHSATGRWLRAAGRLGWLAGPAGSALRLHGYRSLRTRLWHEALCHVDCSRDA